jgi:hypothetical protein
MKYEESRRQLPSFLPFDFCLLICSSLSAVYRLLSSVYRLLPSALCFLVWGISLTLGTNTAWCQVNPAEILNPQLKAAEQTYLPRLQALNRAIASTKFPFAFFLSRYVGLDPQKQAEADTRGLEFVKFHERVLLKVTGNYNAAYNADQLTQNQRASRVFNEVVAPILRLFPNEIPADVACDAIGFEISYHVRRQARNYDYEGKEILVVVLDKAGAFGYFSSPRDSARQDILNRSEIYLNGKEFGLALDEREPFNVEALERSLPRPSTPAPESVSSRPASGPENRLSRINQDLPPGFDKPEVVVGAGLRPAPANSSISPRPDKSQTPAAPVHAATRADAERLQTQYQSQLDALAKEGVAKLHFVEYAPPSFVIFRKRICLQFTLRNTLHFEKDAGSIYKRAAQSFDLFLAPQLKALVDKVPASAEFDGLDITLLNQLATKPAASSEALEFVCPLTPLRQFLDADITNQELINQSVVLVNGVRITLDLQKVE